MPEVVASPAPVPKKKRPAPVGGVAPFPRKRFEQFLSVLKVQTKDYGLQNLRARMLGSQRYLIDEIEKGLAEGCTTFVVLKARGLGSTTILLALKLFWMMEYSGLSAAFATHEEAAKESFRNIIETFFAHLPTTHKITSLKHNRNMLVLKNGSVMRYLTAGTKETGTAGLGRSGHHNASLGTEVAFWGKEDDIKEFRATLSSIYPHRLQIWETTANGPNHFQEMWEAAQESPTQRAIFIGWWRNESYSFEPDHPYFKIYMPEGDETKLTVLERKRAREVKEQYGYDVTSKQIAWYRWKLNDDNSGDQSKTDEQYPWTAEDAFVATGSRFFTNESLTDAYRHARRQAVMPFRYVLGNKWTDTGVVPMKDAKRAILRIWEEAHPQGVYAIGADPAYGSSDEADSSVLEVMRCYADRCVQVAEFASPQPSTYQFAWALAHLAGYYRNVKVNLEISGPGTAVMAELNMLRRDTVAMRDESGRPHELASVLTAMAYYLYQRPDSMRGDLAFGWRMTNENKRHLMNSFKDSFELNRCILNSMHLLDEMKTIVFDDGEIRGAGRAKDDRVVAAALAHEGWKKWIQPMLVGRGLTFVQAQADQERGRPDQLQGMVLDYMRRARIEVQK